MIPRFIWQIVCSTTAKLMQTEFISITDALIDWPMNRGMASTDQEVFVGHLRPENKMDEVEERLFHDRHESIATTVRPSSPLFVWRLIHFDTRGPSVVFEAADMPCPGPFHFSHSVDYIYDRQMTRLLLKIFRCLAYAAQPATILRCISLSWFFSLMLSCCPKYM